MINWWFTELGEREKAEMIRSFSEKRLTLSHSVERAEKLFSELLDVPYVVMTNSGSSALLMSLLALDVQPSDEVIVPSLTWIATAQAPAILNAQVKICDCQEDAPIMDAQKLKKIVTKKTKAIIPVHLNGRACDLTAIQEIASSVGAYVIEDTCKGLFSKEDQGYLGTIGHMGCYSLGMISPVSVGYGGLVVTRDKSLYEKLKKIRDHGVQRSPENYSYLGFNFKISDILASLAIPQLENIREKLQKLVTLHEYYEQGVKNPAIRIMPIDKKKGKVPVYVEAYTENREALVDYLAKKDMQVSRYHLPVNQAAYLKDSGSFPHAQRFAEKCLLLPSGPSQNLEDVKLVVEALNQFAI